MLATETFFPVIQGHPGYLAGARACGEVDGSGPPFARCQPIFIVGSPRSGTSVLTWCLGQHPNILVQEESNWLGSFAQALQWCFAIGTARGERSQLSSMGIGREEFFQSMGGAIEALILSHRSRFEILAHESAIRNPKQVNPAFCSSRAEADPKRRWVDGTPEYSFCITGLRHLFPGAKFIHLLRDVDSVVRSLLKFGHGVVASEEEAYRYWLRTVQACVAAEKAYGSEVVTRIRYCDLVKDPLQTLQRCLTFLNEPFVPSSLEPLGTRINSSHVPPEFDPADPATNPQIREEARQLSRELLAERGAFREPDPSKTSALEDEFIGRARHVGRASDDLDQALKCLARAERELGETREPTSAEAARELVRTETPYNARIVVIISNREPVPYLNGRMPIPLLVRHDPDQRNLTAQLRAMRESGVRYLLAPRRVFDPMLGGAAFKECIDPFYRVVREFFGWTLYVS